MHAFSLSLSAQPPSHTQTQPVSWWSRTCLPKINKTLFKSCSSIKLIFIVSAHGSRGQEIFAFYLPLDYRTLLSDMQAWQVFQSMRVDMDLCALQC